MLPSRDSGCKGTTKKLFTQICFKKIINYHAFLSDIPNYSTIFATMIQNLSILIPSYDTCCFLLVKDLSQQAASIQGLNWEIIVADDGSFNEELIRSNQAIQQIPQCRYIIREENVGRARIRNFLAKEAKYDWLLFIDDDMQVVDPNYINNYLSADKPVVYGGYTLPTGNIPTDKGNLRYLYEKVSEKNHDCKKRSLFPNRDFHTANFLIQKSLLQEYPFDERFSKYGYEDVLYGKTLALQGITIHHIDNPLAFCGFDDNETFIRKTEESLCTLNDFSEELAEYSTLLGLAERLTTYRLCGLVKVWHRLMKKWERRNLISSSPSLLLFRLYKIGFFITIHKCH